jgi:Arc/MetJ-type ribon-helix-helix transcriptional regulator
MVLPRIKIRLPIEEKLRIDVQLASRGYLSFSEYVRDLIRRDITQARSDAFKALLLQAKKQAKKTARTAAKPSKAAA